MAAPAFVGPRRGFVHEAFFYRTIAEYVAATAAFVNEGFDNGEPVMVMIPAGKWRALRPALPSADRVTFIDMREVGRNPSRIIAAWNDFVGSHNGQPARGVGEPIWPERTDAEMVECHRHEALLNAAFPDAEMWLVCPYDVAGLGPDVIEQAKANHPHLLDGPSRFPSAVYDHPDPTALLARDPLSPRPGDALVLDFDGTDLHGLRHFVGQAMRAAGVDTGVVDSIELVVSELAGNSIRHGGGGATVAIWHDATEAVIEVTDRGTISNALVGRLRPSVHETTGRGLYIVNHCADLVELRSFPECTTVRAHFLV